jgi:hypothetical protein
MTLSSSDRIILEELVAEMTARTWRGTVSVAIEKIAEEIAKETLQDEDFRRALHLLVREQSRLILERLNARSAPPS